MPRNIKEFIFIKSNILVFKWPCLNTRTMPCGSYVKFSIYVDPYLLFISLHLVRLAYVKEYRDFFKKECIFTLLRIYLQPSVRTCAAGVIIFKKMVKPAFLNIYHTLSLSALRFEAENKSFFNEIHQFLLPLPPK